MAERNDAGAENKKIIVHIEGHGQFEVPAGISVAAVLEKPTRRQLGKRLRQSLMEKWWISARPCGKMPLLRY